MIIYPIKNFNLLFVFKKNKRFTTRLSIFLCLAFLNLTVGCSYYNVRHVSTPPENMGAQIEELNINLNYIVVHSGEIIWHLSEVKIDIDNGLISGNAQYLDPEHHYQNKRELKRVHNYHKSKQSPLNELHLYLDSIAMPKVGHEISIPISKINNVSVNDKNTTRIVGVVMASVGVLCVLGLIVFAIEWSEPEYNFDPIPIK